MTRGMAAALALTVKNLCFPLFCKRCGQRLLTDDNGYFCPDCWELSPRVRRPFCTICGKPHQGAVGFGALRNFPCAKCREKPAPPYRRIYGAAYYADAIEEAIKLFKFRDKPRLARPLGALMRAFAAQELECEIYDILVPVPLHRVRLRDRGYNQSLLLAEEIAEAFPNGRIEQPLKRIRPTRVQSRLETEEARRENVKGAFAIEESAALAEKTVLLVDDVITTAGTVSECAEALVGAGAAGVDAFAAALAVYRPPQP